MKFLKLLVLTIIYLASFVPRSLAEPILKFNAINQIFGSYLTIDSDGRVLHVERSCCPPNFNTLASQPLSPLQLLKLKQLIKEASLSKPQPSHGNDTAMGSISGKLLVYIDGLEYTLIEVDRSIGEGLPDYVLINSSAASQEIRKIVANIVKNDLPY